MDFDALLPSLASGKIHVSIAALTIQEDRQENAFFSDPYFHATQKSSSRRTTALSCRRRT